MNNEDKKLWSAQEIADYAKTRLSAVLYVISREGIACIDVIANRRVFSTEQRDIIIDCLIEIKEAKNVN